MLYMSIHLFIVMGLNMSIHFCGTKEFITYKTFLHRLAYYFIAMTGQKYMYYSPWGLTDAAMRVCGISYDGYIIDDKGQKILSWDRITSNYIWKLETGTTPVEMMGLWNHQIHKWLKYYVQARVV